MDVDRIVQSAKEELSACTDAHDLDTIRIKYLGRKGSLTALLRAVKDLPPAERPAAGAAVNAAKLQIEELLSAKEASLGGARSGSVMPEGVSDPTLPAHDGIAGRRHILSRVFREMKNIFRGLGYSIAHGPDVELEYYNFQALNFPEEHPSRDLQDTFYITDDILLRTQTSPVQVRFMDQVEGLYVDTDVTMADLKKDVELFTREMFGPNTRIRFRPHFFPFTEPSAEADMSCFACQGSGCAICGHAGWIEIMGAGMVHPNVLRAVEYDPEVYSGFAFGIGVDRIAMLKHGVNDIRLFLGNDLRFLEQF
ncbi:MAG: phenylalanine--tRNA ligase subunit alpha [Chitinivibrionia bacterium]|nr:phenylalanine--tRNA ligase subunit alpha [Chitinivibrionia bacterium]